MSQEASARVMAYIDPELKKRFYASLAKEDLTYKDWLVREATKYCNDSEQPILKFGKS
jgi:hypothetical protein